MKLRLVKFLTSRGNEIERKEKQDHHYLLRHHPARPRPELPPHYSPPPPFIISFSSPSIFAQPASTPPPQLALRHVSGEQYTPAIPFPAVPLLPSFFIKLPKQSSVAGWTVAGTYLTDPAVLLNDNVAAPSSPPSSLLHPIGWQAPLRSKGRSIHSGWSHRKTRTENELSCFITFIDE